MLVLIFSCKKNLYKLNKNRYIKDLDNYLIVLADPEQPTGIQDKILNIQCQDTYEAFIVKVVLAYQYVYDNLDFNFVLKIDDDCHLITKYLDRLDLSDYMGINVMINYSMDRSWHINKCSDERYTKFYNKPIVSRWAGGGYSYILSKKAIGYIIDQIPYIIDEYDNFEYEFEDKRIGDILFFNGIHLREYQYQLTIPDYY